MIDGVANTAPVPQGTNKVFSRKAGTEALSSAGHLRYKAKNKAPQRAKSEVTVTSLSKSSSVKSALPSEVNGSSLSADSGAYAAQRLRVLPKFSAAKLEIKHMQCQSPLR